MNAQEREKELIAKAAFEAAKQELRALRERFEAMRQYDTLTRYLTENDEPGEWYVLFDELVGRWFVQRAQGDHRDPTKQYRSERVIRELCRRLNDGEVVL